MNAQAIREMLNRRPFEPFEVVMSSGERHPIRRPEMALLLRSRLVVAVAEDRMVICPLLHSASVETLQSA